ncbi:MAG TPA: hypothetical protein VF173_30750 [Thermoanaerobaculia bacterium]|nr:hypothetical protein [Thermoanaerobaculia bacterium]
MTTIQHVLRPFALLAAGLCLASAAFAGGPLELCNPGQPFLWPNGGTNIPFNPDQGNLGPLTNAQAVALVASAFQQWGNVPTASTTYLQGAPLPVNVDITNFGPYLEPAAPDGLSAIVFDEDGSIFDLLFGPGSGVLGFASPEWADQSTCRILEGVAFINGSAFTGPDALAVALDILTHEFGHYQNLAHTVVNGQILLGDNTGPSPNDTFPLGSLTNQIETMYPFYFGTAAGFSTPDKDDVAALSALYPEPSFATTTGKVTGSILGPNGTTQLTGVNVIARNVANPFGDAVSAISSDYTFDYTQGAPFVGTYTLRNLTPGAQYAIYVDEILAGGFSTPPLSPLPGPEEFYNGAGESTNGSTDVPTAFTPVTVAAGGTVSNVNILFNAPAPGVPLPVGDDGSVQVFMPFTFEICGQRFDSLFVNANGNVTFGASDASFSESIDGFLAGPPRIAGVWDDLNPSAGGSVFFQQTSNTFTVTYQNVPEFPATGANNFSITLQRSSNNVDVSYGALTATDGLAGVSCGGAVTSGFEMPSNLTRDNGRNDLHKQPAIFELFGPGNLNDLASRTVKYDAKAHFDDQFESNNSLARARRIDLPFYTADLDNYTDISPAGHDADYFKFHVKAGDILAVEVVRGTIDTVLGLFDADTGTLLAADDDGGNGLLSRLLVQANTDLNLAVAVSTFPDVDFSGDGAGSGRYVLSISKYRGTILAAGDDTATPLNLGFTFPYQGTNWTSLFVNSNGNLTFGAGDTDFSESVPEFLAGPPRIAPRWDDLDAGGGLIIASTAADSGDGYGLNAGESEKSDHHDDHDGAMTIHYVSVPEFFSTSPNYFSVKLEQKGDVGIDYAATSRTDGLTGITKGGGSADPGEINFSRDDEHSASGTIYELFTPADIFSFDLFFTRLRFEKDHH